jgi:hypothetical protein
MKTPVAVLAGCLAFGFALAPPYASAQENLIPWHRIGASGEFDMSTGDTDSALSATVGQCIAGWTGTDPPIEPAAAAGFWYVVWTTGTHVYVGWNWLSLPNHPMFPEASAVFDPWVRNNLFRWNRVLKSMELYPDDFTLTEVGEGYIISGRDHHDPVYSGYIAYPDYEIPLPGGGAGSATPGCSTCARSGCSSATTARARCAPAGMTTTHPTRG